MENKEASLEFDLDELLSEFQSTSSDTDSMAGDVSLDELDAGLAGELKELDALLTTPAEPANPVSMDTVSMIEMIREISAQEASAPPGRPG